MTKEGLGKVVKETLIASTDDREEAAELLHEHAATLVSMGRASRYGVRLKNAGRAGWWVMLVDRGE